MTTPNEPGNERDEIEALIEAAAGAFRPRGAIGNNADTRAHPAFYDLDESGRERAFEAALVNRVGEASLDTYLTRLRSPHRGIRTQHRIHRRHALPDNRWLQESSRL